MTSAQHAAWIRRGKPWRLARPLLALQRRLQGYGYTVYALGNEAHLDHQPPEHHCPYSEANWPTYQGKPMPDVVTAIDIMPPGGGGLPSLQALGAQLFADKQAGHAPAAFMVDMNWGPTSNRTAVRDTWRPGHSRGSSGDTGHIHLSCRSDFIDWAGADGYDPVARLRGITLEEVEDDQMFFVAKDTDPDSPTFGQHFVCNGVVSRPLPEGAAVLDAVYLAGQIGVVRADRQSEWAGGVRLGWNEAAFGALAPSAVKVDAAELARAILADASFAGVLAEAAFQGSQRAERE